MQKRFKGDPKRRNDLKGTVREVSRVLPTAVEFFKVDSEKLFSQLRVVYVKHRRFKVTKMRP